jgi:hypothetical protein
MFHRSAKRPKLEPGVKIKPKQELEAEPENWRARYCGPPIYRLLNDGEWPGLNASISKSATESGIITVDDNNKDDDDEYGGDGVDDGGLDYNIF